MTISAFADALETSPTPVREALRRLLTKHELKVLPNQRIVAPQITPIKLKELMLLHLTLEFHATYTVLTFTKNHLINCLSNLDLKTGNALEKENSN